MAISSDAWVENLTEGTAQCTAKPVQATARYWAQVSCKNKNGSKGRWGIIAHSKEWDSRIKGNGRRGLMPLILLRQTSAWRVKKTSEPSHRKSIISGLNNAKYTNAHSCTWRILLRWLCIVSIMIIAIIMGRQAVKQHRLTMYRSHYHVEIAIRLSIFPSPRGHHRKTQYYRWSIVYGSKSQ